MGSIKSRQEAASLEGKVEKFHQAARRTEQQNTQLLGEINKAKALQQQLRAEVNKNEAWVLQAEQKAKKAEERARKAEEQAKKAGEQAKRAEERAKQAEEKAKKTAEKAKKAELEEARSRELSEQVAELQKQANELAEINKGLAEADKRAKEFEEVNNGLSEHLKQCEAKNAELLSAFQVMEGEKTSAVVEAEAVRQEMANMAAQMDEARADAAFQACNDFLYTIWRHHPTLDVSFFGSGAVEAWSNFVPPTPGPEEQQGPEPTAEPPAPETTTNEGEAAGDAP